jgi:hypothetical protein
VAWTKRKKQQGKAAPHRLHIVGAQRQPLEALGQDPVRREHPAPKPEALDLPCGRGLNWHRSKRGRHGFSMTNSRAHSNYTARLREKRFQSGPAPNARKCSGAPPKIPDISDIFRLGRASEMAYMARSGTSARFWHRGHTPTSPKRGYKIATVRVSKLLSHPKLVAVRGIIVHPVPNSWRFVPFSCTPSQQLQVRGCSWRLIPTAPSSHRCMRTSPRLVTCHPFLARA